MSKGRYALSSPEGDEIQLAGPAATRRWGKAFARQLAPGDVVLLLGDVGAGKTTLVRGVVEGLGGDGAHVRSPTFSLVDLHRVSDHLEVIHADLYRAGGGELGELGLTDRLGAADAIALIEWPQPILHGLRGLAVWWVALSVRPTGRVVSCRRASAEVPRT